MPAAALQRPQRRRCRRRPRRPRTTLVTGRSPEAGRAAGDQQPARRSPTSRRRSRPALGLDQLGRDLGVGRPLAVRRAPAARPGRHRTRACCAWQTRRPCQIRWWLSIVQSRFGKSAPTACSALTGSVSLVQPKRRASRPKWVSTVMPGMPKALPSTTLAVLRPTPGSLTRSSRRGGTSPPWSLDQRCAELEQRLGLGAEEPSGRMICSSLSRSAAAIAPASG